MPIWVKYLITAGLVVVISEVARRSDRLGAFIGAMPWVTTLAMIWLFFGREAEPRKTEMIASHAYYTFWYVLPTLPMFLLIPWLLRRDWNFWLALGLGALLTLVCFGGLGLLLRRFEIALW